MKNNPTKACFFIHNWRTLLLAYLVIEKLGYKQSECVAIAARGFCPICRQLGFANIFDIELYNFNIPYQYRQSMKMREELLQIAKNMKNFIRFCDILAIPHIRDPWMQLAVSVIPHKFICYIEEGCCFTRCQSSEYYKFTDLVMPDPGHYFYFANPGKSKYMVSNIPRFYGTLDNQDLVYNNVLLFDDISAKRCATKILKSLELDTKVFKAKSIIIIGTKDEASSPEYLNKTIKYAVELKGSGYNQVIYKPHPSWYSSIEETSLNRMHFVGNNSNLILLSKGYPLDILLFSDFIPNDTKFISENSSMLYGAFRLNYKAYKIPYYFTRDHLKDDLLSLKLEPIEII